MNNKELIIKTARRLDKFNIDELLITSELDENVVTEILSDLAAEKIVLKNDDTYFFNNKKIPEIKNIDNFAQINGYKQIIIEEDEAYSDFLKLGEDVRNRTKGYVELLNFVNLSKTTNVKQAVELFNETSGYSKIAYSTFARIRQKYNKYGLRGIFPEYGKSKVFSIPNEIYNSFKKYYLTKEKLSAEEALYRAQKHLQREQKIEQPYLFSAMTIVRKLKTEFTKKQIEYFRNNNEIPKCKISTMCINEPLGMEFKQAAKIYLNRLKAENMLEKLMCAKTTYKNHLKPYFDNYTIRELTTKIIAEYKQRMFDNGYKLSTVNTYVSVLKNIIKTVCPKTNKLIVRNCEKNNVYPVNMNILPEDKIINLLNACYKKYVTAYPVLYICLSTGASIFEILALTWDKINFNDNTILFKYILYEQRLIINRSHSNIRKLYFDDKISNILQRKFEESKPELTDFVFKFNSTRSPQQYIENVVLKGLSFHLGIRPIKPRDLQHNFVNICLKQNIPLTFIQKALGYHALTNFFKIYKELIERLEEKTYNPLEKIYKEIKY